MSKKVRKKVNKILKKQLTGVSLFFAVLFLIIGIVIGFYLYNINNKEGFSKIELNGNGIVNLKVGDKYNEEGFTMVIDDYDYADMVLVNGSVDTSKEGVYVITYTLNEDGHNIILTRVVNVVGGEADGK
jgi:hypothetical protein